MESELLPITIVALLLLGLGILVSLNWERGVAVTRERDHTAPRAFGGERGRFRQRLGRAVYEALRAWYELEVRLGSRAIELAAEWWPRVHQASRNVRSRRPTLDSTTGQLLLTGVLSIVLGYLIVTYL